MLPEHKMAASWQMKHTNATVCAGPEHYYAQSPEMLATSRITTDIDKAHVDADAMQAIFNGCHADQLCVAAQAAMGV